MTAAPAAEREVAAKTTSGRPSVRAIAARLLLRRQAGLIAAIIVTMVVFTVANDFFLSTGNLLLLLRSMSTFAIVAFGETLVLVSGEIDLSVGGSYGLGAMVMGLTWLHGVPFVLAVALGLGSGLVVGVFNAFVTTIPSSSATRKASTPAPRSTASACSTLSARQRFPSTSPSRSPGLSARR